MGTSTRFRLLAVLALALLVGGAVGAEAQSPAPGSVRDRDLVQTACSLPHEWLVRTWHGYRSDRSPELQIVPIEPNFVGSGLPHVGPWDYVQRIPMLWYGPGHVPAVGEVDRPVTLADVAPTQAELLGFPFRAPDGAPMREAIAGNPDPPKLVVTFVWDAAGMNVLERWPEDWPFLRSLIPRGVWYTNATLGTTPTSTAQTHATIGTGAFPRNHGLTGHQLRIGGRIGTPWEAGPVYLIEPTLADLYDRAMGNRPLVGMLGTVAIHLGMMGHGAAWGGGERDLAVVRQKIGAETLGAEGFEWNLPPRLQHFYRFPRYVNDVPGFEEDVRAVDAADGRIDGRWRDNDIDQLLQGFETPARIPYQERVLESIVEREGFGADEVPDLLFVNHKMIDYISHVWTMDSPEMQDAVRAEDAALRRLVAFLDRQVGRGEWVLVLTADHGAIPDPKVTGAIAIPSIALASGINAAFDRDGDDRRIVQLVQPTQIFIDETELRQSGGTLEDVARWVMGLTKGDVASGLPPGEADDPIFQAAFPSRLLSELPCLPEARA